MSYPLCYTNRMKNMKQVNTKNKIMKLKLSSREKEMLQIVASVVAVFTFLATVIVVAALTL